MTRTILAILFGLGLGLALALWSPWRTPETLSSAAMQAPVQKAQYQCPMHPHIVSDHPGTCPICGMTLVPKPSATAAQASLDANVLDIDPMQQQLIGLQLAPVQVGAVGASWRTVGRVVAEEPRVRKITVKVEGYVEKLQADFLGKPVTRGQALLSLYSPELVSAQKDYLVAAKVTKALTNASNNASAQELLAATRKRLLLWDIAPEALDNLEKTGEPAKALPLISPITGVVTAKSVVEGAHVSAGDTLFEITDLSEVWVLADVYERELGRVQKGMAADLVLQAFPNTTFHGQVSFIDPVLDGKTRTARVRLTFANPRGDLRPELYGDVIFTGVNKRGLRVPSDAIVHTGARTLVFLALGDGKFAYREVKLGNVVGDYAEVLEGLQEGDEVVTQANFLVDSEARLKGMSP